MKIWRNFRVSKVFIENSDKLNFHRLSHLIRMIADAIKHIVSENTRSEINPDPLTAVHDYIRCFFIF